MLVRGEDVLPEKLDINIHNRIVEVFAREKGLEVMRSDLP